MRFTAAELATLRANLGLPADADVTEIKAAVLGRPPATAPVGNLNPEDAPRPGEDWAEWGHRTGRYGADRVPFWRAQLNAAARHPGGQARMQAAIAAMVPVLADQRQAQNAGPWARDEYGRLTGQHNQAYHTSDTPLSDELHRAVYGPSQEERHREEDLQAEAELSAVIQAEHEAAATAPAPDDFNHLFQPPRD